jgi:mono/diheme cytochrome c family protein
VFVQAVARPAVHVPVAVLLTVAVVVAAAPAPASAQSGDRARGEEIFAQQCAMCHGSDASGMMGMHPALRGAAERLTVEGVEVTVRNGRATTPPMPAFDDRLSDDEIDDVVAYVASLPDGPRNFGPGHDDGMAGSDRGRMMDNGMMGDGMVGDGDPVWMWTLIVVLAAAVAGLGGYLLGRRSPPG